MPHHQVLTFVNALSMKLAARSRHICVFLGAGSSRACGLPDIATLQKRVAAELEPDLRKAFEGQLKGRDLEQALSRLRRITALLAESSDEVDGLSAERARQLDGEICRLIVSELDLAAADPSPMLRFAAWVARADYSLPVEVFTVNYDLLCEAALESLGIAYFDGFVGALHARFRTDLVETAPGDAEWLPSFLVRLWKLHGSVNWAWEGGTRAEVIRLGVPVRGQPAAIYPSDAKYDESRRVPFLVLQDRLRRALNQSETLTLISGYSFGDAHLNEMIFEAARRRPRSEFIAFCHSSIPDALIERAEQTPNLQAVSDKEAVLSGVRGDWEKPDDAPREVWEGEKFGLGDFTNLAEFLGRSSPPQGELEARLGELLARAAAEPRA